MCEFTDRLNRQSVWLAILAIALAVWGLTDVRSRARTDPHNLGAHRSDLTCYTAAGAAIFAGNDPYEATNPRGWHYVYPPLLAILVAPLVPLDTQWQGVIWYAISLLAAWGCYTECRRIWRVLRATDKSAARADYSQLVDLAHCRRHGAANTKLPAARSSWHSVNVFSATRLSLCTDEPQRLDRTAGRPRAGATRRN